MTRKERSDPDRIDGSCRVRIAKGSGTSVEQVNRLLKQFYQAKKMLKTMSFGAGEKGWKNQLGGLFGTR
jgi:signal recognition particle subunit SRP54